MKRLGAFSAAAIRQGDLVATGKPEDGCDLLKVTKVVHGQHWPSDPSLPTSIVYFGAKTWQHIPLSATVYIVRDVKVTSD